MVPSAVHLEVPVSNADAFSTLTSMRHACAAAVMAEYSFFGQDRKHMLTRCTCVMVRSRKGHLQFFMKEYDKALETYNAGLAHDPDNAELKEGIARTFEALDKVPASSC